MVLNQDNSCAELAHVSFSRSQSAVQLSEMLSYLISTFRLQRRFARVEACWSGACTLIPEAFSGQEAEILAFVNEGHNGRVKTQAIANVNIAYQFEPELLGSIERFYPNVLLRHSAAVLCELFVSQLQFSGADAFIHLSDSFIELLIKQKGSLVFYNQFSVETDEDVLYYILFAFEQLHLDPHKMSLFFAGERATDSTLVKDLTNYIGRLQPAERVGANLGSQPVHFYYLLTQQQLCES